MLRRCVDLQARVYFADMKAGPVKGFAVLLLASLFAGKLDRNDLDGTNADFAVMLVLRSRNTLPLHFDFSLCVSPVATTGLHRSESVADALTLVVLSESTVLE